MGLTTYSGNPKGDDMEKLRLNCYETTLVFSSGITDETYKATLAKLKSIIQTHDGEVLAVEDWGKRKLAYPIHKETRGQYFYLVYTGNQFLVTELERILCIHEHMLRYLTVKISGDFNTQDYKHHPTVNAATKEVYHA